MNFKIALSLISILLLAVLSACGTLKNIPGNIAGQVLNESGSGRGFVSVQLVNVEDGAVVSAETTDDRGNFMFKDVKMGKYKLQVVPSRNAEPFATDAEEFRLSPGKTEEITVTILSENTE